MSIVAARADALLLVARGALSNAIIAGAMKYDFLFEDGSFFSVPPGWREVSGRRFGAVHPVEFEARLRFVIGEYRANRAMPSKFDEIGCEKET